VDLWEDARPAAARRSLRRTGSAGAEIDRAAGRAASRAGVLGAAWRPAPEGWVAMAGADAGATPGPPGGATAALSATAATAGTVWSGFGPGPRGPSEPGESVAGSSEIEVPVSPSGLLPGPEVVPVPVVPPPAGDVGVPVPEPVPLPWPPEVPWSPPRSTEGDRLPSAPGCGRRSGRGSRLLCGAGPRTDDGLEPRAGLRGPAPFVDAPCVAEVALVVL